MTLALLFVVFAVFLLTWIITWRRARRAGVSHLRCFCWGIVHGIGIQLIGYIFFILLWGLGYERVPLERRLQLDDSPVTSEELASLSQWLVDVVRQNVREADAPDPTTVMPGIAASLENLISNWDGKPITIPPVIKTLPDGWLMVSGSWGMSSPYFYEAHVDGALPRWAFVAVAAHELAHVAGYCSEDEADAAGLIAAIRADDSFARYSGALGLFEVVARQLPSAERQRAYDGLPERARADLREARDVTERHRVQWWSDLQSKVYDAYLRGQGVDEGIENYARAAELAVWLRRGGLLDE